MGEVIDIRTGSDYDMALEMAEQLRPGSGEITHGIAIYRTKNGNIKFRLFAGSADHVTYVIGLLDRMKMTLHAEAAVDKDSS